MVFEYDDYKTYVNSWVESQERAGYGQYSRFAEELSTTSVAVSQIFKGPRDLNLEQALKLATYFGMSNLEKRYFMLLVERSRAGTSDLVDFFNKQLLEIRAQSLSIKNIIEHSELTDEDKELFYSSWIYIAIWLAADIADFSSIAKLAVKFRLSEEKIREVTSFLVDRGLLLRTTRGFSIGKNVVHLPKDSPMILRHHFNWRMKALESVGATETNKISYSAPMSLSEDVANEIQNEILRMIKKVTKKASDSQSEKLFCLNIDWFSF